VSQKPFIFKQFTISQNQCAMKIGTDAVLLGAWTRVTQNPNSILDIGAGTGILAIMLAQRTSAEFIDALEMDDQAFEQCVDNFENAPWSDRLFCYHVSLEAFVDEIEDQYELIISNPPYYSEDYKTTNNQRNLARFTDALPAEHLLVSVSKLLSKNGLFSVIIPFKDEKSFIASALNHGLFVNRICHVKGHSNTVIKRSLLEFSSHDKELIKEELVIETGRHEYTKEYINLTKDFYLKM
jgi:tRNA1Val (adenine37-N6)-methyltransferase